MIRCQLFKCVSKAEKTDKPTQTNHIGLVFKNKKG